MKRRNVLILAACALVFVAASGAALYFVQRTFTTTGERAVAAMNAEERAALARLSTINRRMTAEQVHAALGPPTEDILVLAKWNGFGGSPLSQVRVYFVGDRPAKVRWMKLGYFVYERTL